MSRRPDSRSSRPPQDSGAPADQTQPQQRRSPFSIEIRGQVGRSEGTDTDVDETKSKKKKLKRKRRRSEAPAPRPEVDDNEATPVAPPPPELVKTARLDALRVHEQIGRSHRHSATPKKRLPTEPSANLPRVRIGWVRSEDTGQHLEPYKRHGFYVEGLATGVHTVDRRREQARGGVMTRGPALAIGIEGQIWSVRVDGGETPLETATRFAERLSARFEVTIEDQQGVRALVRVLRERPRRGPIE